MKKLHAILILISLVIICSSFSVVWPQVSDQGSSATHLVAAGSGVNLAITRVLAEAFMKENPHITIDVPGSIGTKGAIKAAVDNAIAIGLISRPLNEYEKGLGLAVVPYARSAIVIGVHPNVEEEGISFDDLVLIFQGTKAKWGDGNEIVVISREQGDSGFQVIEKAVPGFREAYAESQQARRWAVYFTDQDANLALTSRPYSVGVSDFGMITTEKLNIKVLKVNGLLPTADNVLSGQYPLTRTLSFVHSKQNVSEAVKAFIEFVRSEAGAKVLKTNGYLPVD